MRIEIGSGAPATRLVLGIHALALPAVLTLDWPWALRLALLGLVIGSALDGVWRVNFYRHLVWRADGRWEVGSRFGDTRFAVLLPRALVTPWGCVLHLRRERDARRLDLVLLPGAVPAGDLRRLRVRLRREGAGAV